ncbi:MAG: hypothetical protein EOO88_49515 [Pedobacter sp.]|nr:MAG: hypothetical protein EOO88_49515 [Pedobacter sp.]
MQKLKLVRDVVEVEPSSNIEPAQFDFALHWKEIVTTKRRDFKIQNGFDNVLDLFKVAGLAETNASEASNRIGKAFTNRTSLSLRS